MDSKPIKSEAIEKTKVPIDSLEPVTTKIDSSHTTTVGQEELRTAGQRRINLIWEVTQAIIAISVTIATLWISGNLLLREGGDSAGVAFLLLSNAFFMIMTSYHTRTNHTKQGGVSAKGER